MATQTGHGWDVVAFELAARLPGQLWPGYSHVSWTCGAGGVRGIVFCTSKLQKLRAAQDVLADLGCLPEMPWSHGRLARACIDFVNAEKRPPCGAKVLLDGISLGYHDCLPGVYPDATLYDVKACYYQLLSRMRTPFVYPIRGGKLHWEPLTPSERSRWNEMLDAVGGDHLLRNCIVGAGMGASGRRPMYMRDTEERARRVLMHLPGGKWRGTGALIVRSAYELCLLASKETDSKYSTIDSVTVERASAPPLAWRRHAIDVDIKASGPADIRGRGCWQIGPTRTLTYRKHVERGGGWSVGVPRAAMPETQWHSAWL